VSTLSDGSQEPARRSEVTDRDTLIRLLAERSLFRGHFVLASGRSSSVYVDARLTTMSPQGLALIGPFCLGLIRSYGWRSDAVGGLTMAADPIAYAISMASATHLPLVRAFSVRKEMKQHGTGRLIEGPLLQTDHVVVVEDVITTGASALRAAEAVRSFGAVVSGILGLVDREEGGRAAIREAGYDEHCFATVTELLARS
jgi:orotate phosphoribosyltransferase